MSIAAVLQLVGIALVTVGAALLMPAAGFIVGGILLTAVGLAFERGASNA